ncbi:nucleotidyltransferase family protein [Luteipulveratus mongoliensis]|uniref:nucleotidyltransferase family protein n=1 Tax=Luteipulveratus mongoliensis TaxID=571913 RepID=UPI000696C04B|nr:nucleotidyltransferase family protein [Luteipulveratus mongoliensis]
MAVGIVLAGGYGTRMLPLTEHRPKHLLPVGPDPIVVHQLRRLAGAGIADVVLATGFCADQFEPALGDGSRWGVRLRYAPEPEPLGTAGALRHAYDAVADLPEADTLVVLNGDLLSGHDLRAQVSAYESSGAEVSIHVRQVADPRAYGSVVLGVAGRVQAFVEKSPNPPSDLINAGTYVVSRSVAASIPSGRKASWEHEVVPGLIERGTPVVGFREEAYFRDIGSPSALVAASVDAVLGDLPGAAGAGGRAWIAATADVDPTARVDAGSAVHDGAVIGPRAQVSGSIVMAGGVVGGGAVVRGSVLAPMSVVGAGARLVDEALADGEVRSATRPTV